jgi:plasmid stability protein
MAQLFITDLDAAVAARLAARARRHGRSLEDEARAVLENAVRESGFEEDDIELPRTEEKGLGDLMYERFKDRGLTEEEFVRFTGGIFEINDRSAMRIPDFEADDFEEAPADK